MALRQQIAPWSGRRTPRVCVPKRQRAAALQDAGAWLCAPRAAKLLDCAGAPALWLAERFCLSTCRCRLSLLVATCIAIVTGVSSGDTHYVSLAGGNVPPYTNWVDAATNIQAAVDAAAGDDTVLVASGTYVVGTEIFVTNAVTVQSVKGSAETVVTTDYPLSTNRCFHLIHAATVINGFTISNGRAVHPMPWGQPGFGGGVLCERGTVRNCVLVSNTAKFGGGVCLFGGCIEDCVLSNNIADRAGGGVMLTGARIAQRETLAKSNILPLSDTSSLSVVRCVVIGNYAQTGGGLHIEAGQVERCFVQSNTAGFGGGAAVETGELLDSVIIGNTAFEAGGVIIGQAGRVEQCVISGNRAQFGGGVLAGNGLGTESLIRNCRVSDNMATNVGGIVVDEGGIVANCTITGNTASDVGGVGLLNGGRLLNTIVYYNTGTSNGGNWTIEDPTPSFAFTCTDPPPPGTGNITNDPCLTPDFHLKANSPCIDAGTDSNAPPTDIDGEARWDDPRHSNVVSIVDIGADEFVDVDLDSMADSWETNYFGNITNRDGNADADSDDLQDLPEYENGTCPTNRDTDADLMPDGWEVGFVLNPLSNDAGLDQDSDGADNLAEYVADTDPRAPASFLGFFRIGPQAGGTRLDWHGGVQAWQFLECRECVADTNAPWTPILALPPPTPLTNAVIDLGATNRALFYRLRAER